MGFLESVHRGTWSGSYSLKDPALASLYGFGSRTAAGPIVNEITALAVSAFWSGVDQISSDVAKLPLTLLKRLPGGGSEPYTESKAYRLLKFRPNVETGSFMLRKTWTAHALVYGNGYNEIVRDGMGRPTALWLLHPNRVRPFYAETTSGRKPLRYLVDGEVELKPENVLHLAGLSDDGVVGYNMVSVAREILGLALASQGFASAFFGNGTRFGGVLSSDQELDNEQKEEIRAEIDRVHAKADKAFRMLVLGAGFKFTQVGVNPSEAQMSQVRDQLVADIARFLNLPLHKMKLAIPGAVSYASVEMADLDYYKGPILTWTKASEEELDAKLISSLEWGRQYFKHNNNAFLRGDIKSRYEALATARAQGIINANEWRELEDMNPQPGEQGNIYVIQGGNVPLDKMGDLAQAQIDKLNEPTPAPQQPGGGERERVLLDAVTRFDGAQLLLDQARADLASKMDESGVIIATKDGEITTLLAKVATFEHVVAERQRDVERLEAAQESHTKLLTEGAASLQKAFDERDQSAEAARVAAEQAAAAEARLEQLQQRVDEVTAAVKSAEALADEARTIAAVAEADALNATTDRTALAVTSALLQQEADDAKALVTVARAEQQRLTEALDEERRLRGEAVTTARTNRQAEIAKLAAVLAAHRALVADVLRRLVERETDRAKSHQHSPDKLRAWMETFYGKFEDSFIEAILPAVRVVLSWKGSADDPRGVAVGMAQRYCQESTSQLRAFFGAPVDDFAVAVDHLLRRWEKDRPEAIADALLEEEIAHLRELERNL